MGHYYSKSAAGRNAHTEREEPLLPVPLTSRTVTPNALHHKVCWNIFTENSYISGVEGAALENDKPQVFPLSSYGSRSGDP